MADLRTRFATLDATPVPDLWPEIERRAAAGAGTSRIGRIGPTWRGSAPSVTGQRLVLAMALLGLLAIALLGVAIAGSLLRDPLRGLVPPAVADVSADASPLPEASPQVGDLPKGVTALPSCPDGPVAPVDRGTLPDFGPAINATGRGRIAMVGDTGVYALDPAADPPIAFGMAPPLARFLYNPLASSTAWSPDGRWLAFVATGGVVFGSSPRRVYCQDVFVVPAAGGVAVNLTEHVAWTGVMDIAWSADGRWLAYAAVDAASSGDIFDPPESPAPDPARTGIQVVRLDDDMTIAERRQVWSGRVYAGLAWSWRGELAFAGGDDGRLMLLGPGETVVREQALRDINSASWAPDADRILLVDGDGRLAIFDAHGDRAPVTQELWVPEAPRTDGSLISRQYIGDAPQWMPDGRAIVMTITDESASGRDSEVVKITMDGDDVLVESLLAVDPVLQYPMAGPVVSPDGSLVAYSLDGVGGGDDGVWVMRADGTGQRRISAPLGIGMAGPAAWQPLP